jgi:hypothetical protein
MGIYSCGNRLESARTNFPGLLEERLGGWHEVLGSNPCCFWKRAGPSHCDIGAVQLVELDCHNTMVLEISKTAQFPSQKPQHSGRSSFFPSTGVGSLQPPLAGVQCPSDWHCIFPLFLWRPGCGPARTFMYASVAKRLCVKGTTNVFTAQSTPPTRGASVSSGPHHLDISVLEGHERETGDHPEMHPAASAWASRHAASCEALSSK